jgi:2,3-bisphosphoglycerate-dependent phosphoglycerate mutase
MTTDPAPTRVLCIRHGETAWNATRRWQGNAPVPLNEAGLAQSAALGRYLARNGFRVDALYSSDLPRAMQTAGAVADALGLTIVTESRLREIDLGDWQGLTHDEVAAWDGERFAQYQAAWRSCPPPNGESRLQLQVRARAAFDDISARHPGQTLALVSHGGTLGMLIESLFGIIERPSLTNTSITLVERADPAAPWTLVKVAWSPHLDSNPLGETW